MRTLIDLDRTATVLDAAERVAATPPDGDVAIVVAAGAPLLRNAVFLEVARRTAEPRRFALVTSDERARSLAASVHVPAYASVAALERHELDATERLDRAQAAAMASLPRRSPTVRVPAIGRRTLGITASLAAALLAVLVVIVPDATITVAPMASAIGPLDFELRAGPGGDIAKGDLSATVTARVAGSATDSRTDEAKAKGLVRFQNRTTGDIRMPGGTLVQTQNGVRFVTTEEKTLPRSVVVPPFTIVIGQVDIAIEAVVAGPGGNIPANQIAVSLEPERFTVTNPAPTTGGETKKVSIVGQQDYEAARQRADGELQAAAERQLAEWRTSPRPGTVVVPRVFSKVTSLTPASEVVKKEVTTFELQATGVATAFTVREDDLRKAALARLRGAESSGFALNEGTAVIEVTIKQVTESGVITYGVRATGRQVARLDRDRIRRSLVGRSPSEARPALEELGVRLVQIESRPRWWPRLPLLEPRIEIREAPAVASGS